MSFIKDVLQLIGITGMLALWIATFICVLAIFPVAIMLLWNWLMPHIFGLTTINFWEALGIILVTWILFK